MAVNRITTIFDFSERGQGLKKIKADMAEVDGSINKAKVGVKGLWAEFAGSRAAQAAVGALAVKIGTDAVIAASNLEESINAVNVTYGESADEIHKLGEVSAESFGLSQRAFNEAAVMFSSFAKTVAGEGGNVSEVVQEITQRAADFASVHNIEVAEAMRVFQSALAGEQEPIKRFGKDLSAAAVEAYALESGLAASKSEITESIKQQARYGLLMRETADTAGDFLNTQDGLANSTKTLTGQFEDLQAQLGRQLLPMVADTTSTLVDMADVLGDIGDNIERLGQVTPGWVKTYNEAFGPGAVKNILIDKPLEMVSWAFDKVGVSAEESAFSVDKAKESYYQQAHAAGRLAPKVNETTEAFEENARQLRENARESTYNADAQNEMGRIQAITTGIVDRARQAQERFMQSIRHTRDEVGKLKRDIDDRQAWLNLRDTFDATTETMNNSESSMRDMERALLDLKADVLDYAESINLPQSVTTKLIAEIDQGKRAEVEAFLLRIGNGVTLPINPEVRGSFNRSSRSRGGPTLTAEGNLIPRGATGGIVTQPTMALIGEAGPEAVVPLNRTPGSSPLPSGGLGGSVTYNINVTAPTGANADDFGRKVMEAIRREQRWRGPVEGM